MIYYEENQENLTGNLILTYLHIWSLYWQTKHIYIVLCTIMSTQHHKNTSILLFFQAVSNLIAIGTSHGLVLVFGKNWLLISFIYVKFH